MFSTALILQTFFAAVKLQKEECMKDSTKSKTNLEKGLFLIQIFSLGALFIYKFSIIFNLQKSFHYIP